MAVISFFLMKKFVFKNKITDQQVKSS